VSSSPQDLLAIEVGSSCVKLGWFPAQAACTSEKPAGNLPIAAPALPEPAELRRIQHRGREAPQWTAEINAAITAFGDASQFRGVMASVHPGAAETVRQTLEVASKFGIHTLKLHDTALVVRLDEPQRVGIDRLLGAVAANRLRRPDRPAIVVDMGTATTVNFIAADGAFEGGAILPGPLTSLHALHKATASLPLLTAEAIDESPPLVGKSTQQAMASGAYWGAVGAVQELILRMAKQGAAPPDIFLTGGASHAFADALRYNGQRLRHVPYLNLAGIKLVADELARA
jgi:type III pantothenate kinase